MSIVVLRESCARVAFVLPVLLLSTACDIATAELRSTETAEWRKSYTLAPGGTVEIANVNGRIDVEGTPGRTLEVVAHKKARGSTPEAAREMLERMEIADEASSSAVRIETQLPRGGGFRSGGTEVRYSVKVPASANVRFTTVNGGVRVSGVDGAVVAEATNGGVEGADLGGAVDASTTNGGVTVSVKRLAEGGVKLECTNGGLRLRLPSSAKATISARTTNGGIQTDGLPIQPSEGSRRRLESTMNGGGAPVRLSGTNGGIRIERYER